MTKESIFLCISEFHSLAQNKGFGYVTLKTNNDPLKELYYKFKKFTKETKWHKLFIKPTHVNQLSYFKSLTFCTGLR